MDVSAWGGAASAARAPAAGGGPGLVGRADGDGSGRAWVLIIIISQ